MSEYELYHHGVKGMKWGVRRYQNKDGSLTSAGKKRFSKDQAIKDARVKNAELNKKRLHAINERKAFYDNIDPDKDYDSRIRYRAQLKPVKQKQLDKIDSTIRSIEHEIYTNDKLAKQKTTGEKIVSALNNAGAMAGSVAALVALGYVVKRV